VEGHERIRLFVALRLPDETVEKLSAWQHAELAAADARIVVPGNLHITLAFLGSRPQAEADGIAEALRGRAQAAAQPLLTVRDYRETRSVGMVRLEDDEGRATMLADGVGEDLERLGVYEREQRAWLPHVTVLRFRKPPRLRPEPPDLRPFSPSEVALMMSVLRPTGAQYEVVESIPLGG
jgi:2'-5' RNA ligase